MKYDVYPAQTSFAKSNSHVLIRFPVRKIHGNTANSIGETCICARTGPRIFRVPVRTQRSKVVSLGKVRLLLPYGTGRPPEGYAYSLAVQLPAEFLDSAGVSLFLLSNLSIFPFVNTRDKE